MFDVKDLCNLKTSGVMRLFLLAGCFTFGGATHVVAQETHNHAPVAQIVALDECDPTTFNAGL